jgi:hypothetical protein
LKFTLYLSISVFLLIILLVEKVEIYDDEEGEFWGIGESPSFVDGSGYLSINTSATANVFELKEVTSRFSVGNIITIGDSKKEHEITEVTELQKSKSGNSQSIILMEGVGFETNTGLKVSVVR